MADNTNRFGLNTYSQGDTNWDHTDTVQTIDELAIERGAAADRPASGNYDDELYLATDQQILYRWDETATDWIVEGVGSETDPLPKVWANEIDVNALEAEDINTESLTASEVSVGNINTDRMDMNTYVGDTRTMIDAFDYSTEDISEFWTGDIGDPNDALIGISDRANVYAESSLAAFRDDDIRPSIVSMPGDGLLNYPIAGDSMRYYGWMYEFEGIDRQSFFFGVQDYAESETNPTECYEVRIDDGEEINLRHIDDEEATVLASTSIDLEEKEWFEVNVEWGVEGEITVTLSQNNSLMEEITATDSTYDSGGVGFRFNRISNSTGEGQFIDALEITNVNILGRSVSDE